MTTLRISSEILSLVLGAGALLFWAAGFQIG